MAVLNWTSGAPAMSIQGQQRATLEKYLHGRYPGTKRFGLEGGESMIPMLHEILQRLGSHGVIEAVVGMAHMDGIETRWRDAMGGDGGVTLIS